MVWFVADAWKEKGPTTIQKVTHIMKVTGSMDKSMVMDFIIVKKRFMKESGREDNGMDKRHIMRIK